MIDVFKLPIGPPGFIIFENGGNDIILVVGPPYSTEAANGKWRECIRSLCRLIANSELSVVNDEQFDYELWQSLPVAPAEDDLLDYKAISGLSYLSVSTLRNYHASHKMPPPYIYRGGSPLWRGNEIAAWLAARARAHT